LGTYALANLVPWVRRQSRDSITRSRESFTSDGTGVFTLSASGFIQLVSITSDGDPIDPQTEANLTVATLVLDPNDVVDQAEVIVVYDVATFTDADIENFIADAARAVGSDLHIDWLVTEVSGHWILDYVPDVEFVTLGSTTVLNLTVEKLIAMRAGTQAYKFKVAQRSDQAILVQDGSTRIDTSKAATAGGKTLEMMESQYRRELMDAKNRRFHGSGTNY
jgi:hypothetical protein